MSLRAPNILAAFFGLYYLALGLVMLWDPEHWYLTTPSVPSTGPFNPHFVTDVALAFAASGVLWLGASVSQPLRAGLALGAALWPLLHAAFHVAEWVEHGLPKGAALTAEAIGVVAVALLSAALAVYLSRKAR